MSFPKRGASVAVLTVAINAAIFGFLAVLNDTAPPEVERRRTPPLRIVAIPMHAPAREPIEVDLDPVVPEELTMPADRSDAPSTIELGSPSVDPADVRALHVDVDLDWHVELPDPGVGRVAPPVATSDAAIAAPSSARAPAPPSASGPRPATGGGARVPSDAEVDEPPRPRSGNPRPVYPRRERLAGREGSVTVKLLIDERGRVEAVEVLDGAAGFAAAVREVVRSYRFHPARHRGAAVRVWGTMTFHFRIGG